ncbi:MAG: CAAX prenyl protease-related protein [Terriglobia bacterium]|nr:MAG: CAAX prenyl protease-related protein [Terriglobia bacterium]
MAAPEGRNVTAAYTAPFLVYVGMMLLPLSPQLLYPIRFIVVAGVLLFLSRPYVQLRPSYTIASIAIGIGVFVIWIAPDLLFDYRHHWLFDNPVIGSAQSSLAPALREDKFFLLFRVLSSVVLVPVLEELFWRGWLMRWLINTDFRKVLPGTYQARAFWLVALLFAVEHGPYWEVGLLAGILYNWWIVRTKNLGDCILAHAVTNAILAVYVLSRAQWQYWL